MKKEELQWQENLRKKITEELFVLQDPSYREFHSKLMPTVDPQKVIGVRTPQLRKLAKKLGKEPGIHSFLHMLPHEYYEENNLHGFLIEQEKDYEECMALLEEFLPFVDNWATCDLMAPKVFQKHLPELLDKIRQWVSGSDTYTVRFGLGMLMRYYLDGEFRPEYLELAATVRSEEYYINMMQAWFFATALAKQWEAALPYLTEKRLSVWTHNKTIQKAAESFRITKEQKEYLKTLKIR